MRPSFPSSHGPFSENAPFACLFCEENGLVQDSRSDKATTRMEKARKRASRFIIRDGKSAIPFDVGLRG